MALKVTPKSALDFILHQQCHKVLPCDDGGLWVICGSVLDMSGRVIWATVSSIIVGYAVKYNSALFFKRENHVINC